MGVVIPKGRAMALHLHEVYPEGQQAFHAGVLHEENPYDFFGAYLECSAWSFGWQNARNVERGLP